MAQDIARNAFTVGANTDARSIRFTISSPIFSSPSTDVTLRRISRTGVERLR
jgi:hypothetical protein